MDTNIELNILNDGGVLLIADEGLRDVVKRVEFYRDQRLMQLVYHDEEKFANDLMENEVPVKLVKLVEHSPDVIIYSLFKGKKPLGYKVPLVTVGDYY